MAVKNKRVQLVSFAELSVGEQRALDARFREIAAQGRCDSDMASEHAMRSMGCEVVFIDDQPVVMKKIVTDCAERSDREIEPVRMGVVRRK
jgi:phage FluMu protein gp41